MMFAIIIIFLLFCLVLLVAAYPNRQASQLYCLQLSLIKFITLFLITVLLGFQFGIAIPLFAIFLIICIYTLKLRNKVGVSILGIFFGLCAMIISVTAYIHRQHLEHEYFAGAMYFYGIIPAVLLGGNLGLYLALQVKEVNDDTEKRRVLWFLYKPAEKLWSSKN
jgi:hypothetical protein